MKKKHHQIQRMNKLERSPEKKNASLGYIMKSEDEILTAQELETISNKCEHEKRLPRWLRRQKRAPSRGDLRIKPGHDRGFKIT